MSAPSLQRRMSWLVGLPVAGLWLAAGLWLGQRTAHETGEMFDRELERTAASVLVVLASVPVASLREAELDDIHDDEGPRGEIVVRDRGGRLLLDASVLPPLPAGPDAPHFHTIVHEGDRWRVFQRRDAGDRLWIQVAAPLHDRDQLLAAHIRALLVPLAGLLLLLPLATWLGLRRGLAPLRALSRAIAAQPARPPVLTRDDVPSELLQLTRALDALVANLDSALARERRFTADAAHELRHPLSVLRLELDLAGTADGDGARAHLQRARDGLQRMERLVAQLLTLARVESLDHLDDTAALSPGRLAREVLAGAGERAAPRGVVLSLQADDALRVRGSAGLLEIALGNLVDNAIAHGKRHGQVAIDVSRNGAWVELAVEDDGPGIADDQAARLGERFLRGSGSGSGLGLSIAQAIAALHGGDIVLARAASGGARVVLRLPAVLPP
ncbi:ATP-binding protein [Luteimonas sp. 50]|uniref:histidine kinase n=1 Tax=Cognatiluteimonas sedimenti TaxID=2927791 RepID=A0ABT0A157_9GAMM|nr:ATP-binding protein [Lysobacter sedimenti]MCJ0824690.1 ATP-binding protein [Lysobacter sedimenti]